MVTKYSNGRLRGIEFARGCAACLVVFYHAARHMEADIGYLPWGGISKFGHSGVEFFFVLSGFIIFYTHSKDFQCPEKIGNFFKKRFIRLYPFYWFSLLIGLALTAISATRKFPDISTFLYSLTLLPQDGDVGVAWSLHHEILFYMIFAISILHFRAGILVMGIWLLLISISWIGDYSKMYPVLLYRLSSEMNIGFFLGMFSGFLVQNRLIDCSRAVFLSGVVVFFCIGTLENLGHLDGYTPIAHLIYSLGATLIVIGIASIDLKKEINVPSIFSNIGGASYSIYLMHLPCIGIFYKFLERCGLLKILPIGVTYALLIFSGIWGGMILSRFIEFPLMEKFRQFFAKRLASDKKVAPG